ncbi:reverse transcriptase [Plakobranchus ocellatus]|uniref:Reverse transcriptase n=1 Tax=Plakobranchus ocellatus TaxID=259542 RepID=A0AAV4B383_9GAST|nr:reverse transcriptase [Plakobranchus ocellatus]
MNWNRISFKPKKSQSLSIRKSKLDEKCLLHSSQSKYTKDKSRASQEPWKMVWLIHDRHQAWIRSFIASFSGSAIYGQVWLARKVQSVVSPVMLIPKLLWLLLEYEISTSTIESVEAKINRFTRKWLGVPLCLTDVAIYYRKAKLRFPLRSIVKEYKCGKARLMTMLEESEDSTVRSFSPC